MALYTWQLALDELVLRLGKRPDITAVVATGGEPRAARWLQAAQERFARSSLELPALTQEVSFVVTDGVSQYGLTSITPALGDLVGIQSVRNATSGYRMRRFPWWQYRQLSEQSSGSPMRWARRGMTLAFDPQPDDDDEISIQYRSLPTLGVLEVDSPYHEDVIRLATHLGWSALQQHDKAKEALNELPATIRQAVETPLDSDQWEAVWDPDIRVEQAWA